MIMNVIKANNGIVKKTLVFGGIMAAGAIAVLVINAKTNAEDTTTEDEDVVDAEFVEVETEQE